MKKRFAINRLVVSVVLLGLAALLYSVAVVSARIPEQTPPAPGGLMAYWVGKTFLSWSWSPSDGAEYYEFFLDGALKDRPIQAQTTIEGLDINTQYTAKVRACNYAGCSEFSVPKAVYTHIQNAFYPPNNVIPITTDSVSLWLDGLYSNLTAGKSGIDHAVFLYDGEAFGRAYQKCDAELRDRSDAQQNNNPVVFSGLSSSSCYLACGYPTNGDGIMPQNPFNRTVVTTLARPPAKSKVTFPNISRDRVTVSWSSNGNPSMWGSKGNGCSKPAEYQLHNVTRNSYSPWITGTSYQDVKLSSGKQYCYEVRARNAENVETAWVSLGCASTSGGFSDKIIP